MNTKRLPEVIMVACVVGLAAWWFWPVKPAQMKPTVVRLLPAAPTDETSPPATEAPAEPTPVLVAAVETPTPTVDPQAELSTAMHEFSRLCESGDYVTAVLNFSLPNPLYGREDKAAVEERFSQDAQTPQYLQHWQTETIKMQLIENMTPTYDATGNLATYRPPDGSSPVVMVKVNGRWYREQ